MPMLDDVVNRSTVAARIAASGNDRARKHLASARELMQHARTLTGRGQLRGADALRRAPHAARLAVPQSMDDE